MDDFFGGLGGLFFAGGLILVMVLLGFGLHNITNIIIDSPEPQYAQWSQNQIQKCYEGNTSSLECYHMCREHEWIESYCYEIHDKHIMKKVEQVIEYRRVPIEQ